MSPAATPAETYGLFGGSFDPPHMGHVLAAAYALGTTGLDGLYVVPTFEHPLAKRALTPFADRLEMTRLAMRDLRRVEVSGIEAELGGMSRTLRTIEALLQRSPARGLRLVLGSDLREEVGRWHRFDRIAALAPPLWLERGGHASAGGALLPELSSTRVRDALARGEGVRALLPRPVISYIERHGLYERASSETP